MPLIVVTGTGTDVGKTYVTAALAGALGARARKPVQSFAPSDATTDAAVLAAATADRPECVCPEHRWLPTPMAPPMAADALGRPPFTIDDLLHELDAPSDVVTFVEGAGGLLSPLAYDGDTRTLIERCDPDAVLLVADAGLGTINLVRLCVDALAPLRRPIVFLNRYDARHDLHVRNAQWLRTREGLEVEVDLEALASELAERY
jgi:dethiobiotin synthetase